MEICPWQKNHTNHFPHPHHNHHCNSDDNNDGAGQRRTRWQVTLQLAGIALLRSCSTGCTTTTQLTSGLYFYSCFCLCFIFVFVFVWIFPFKGLLVVSWQRCWQARLSSPALIVSQQTSYYYFHEDKPLLMIDHAFLKVSNLQCLGKISISWPE